MVTLVASSGEQIPVHLRNGVSLTEDEVAEAVGIHNLAIRATDGRIMYINLRAEGRLPINWAATNLYEFKDRDFIRGPVMLCEASEAA